MNVVVQFLKGLGADLPALAGFLAAICQLASFPSLLSRSTASATVYLFSALFFLTMIGFSIRHFSRGKRSSKKRKEHLIGAVYATLALIAIAPAVYRWCYIHTDWLPSGPKEEPKPEVGWLRSVNASTLPPLEVHFYLDPARTSFACSKVRDRAEILDAPLSVDECRAFAIPNDRLRQLKVGHGIEDNSPEKEIFDREYRNSMLVPAFEALQAVADYRGKKDPLLDLGPELLFRSTRDADRKARFLSSGILPNADEWMRLTKDQPMLAASLREFIIEWIGFLDPFFRVELHNHTSQTLVVSKIAYTATSERLLAPVTLIGAYDVPRYILELKAGSHEENIIPPVTVPPEKVVAVDLVLRLATPDPGVTYDLAVKFASEHHAIPSASVPAFAITFARGER